MLDNKKRIIIITILFIFVIMAITIFHANTKENNSSSPKPQVKTPIKSEDDSPPVKWYVQFSAKQQTTTAYTGNSDTQRPASGDYYFIGAVAVHPRYPGYDPRIPIIPFGTVIYPTPPLEIDGSEYHSLVVLDTGDVNYALWGECPYWFDVYFGNSGYSGIKNAKEHGTKKHDYYWYEEWK